MLNGQTQPSSVYLSLNSRPKKGEYHWGVVVTDAQNNPVLYHANNRKGPWEFESKSGNPGKSMTLIVLVKVGTVVKNGITAAMQSVPADGKASLRNGEAFSCRTWSKDALAKGASSTRGCFVLKSDPETLESMAKKYAAKYAGDAEQGKGAFVVNSPSTGSQDSTSSRTSTKSTKSTKSISKK